MKPLRTFTSAFALAASVIAAHAVPITYTFSGVYQSGSPATWAHFGSGSTFEAKAVFEAGSAPVSTGVAAYGGQDARYALIAMSVELHSATKEWDAVSNNNGRSAWVTNDKYADEVQFSAIGIEAELLGAMNPYTFNVTFNGSNTILDSTAMPSVFDLAIWNPYQSPNNAQMKVYFDNGNNNLTYRITSVTVSDGSTSTPTDPVATVPDGTATAPLLLGALIGAWLVRRRAKS